MPTLSQAPLKNSHFLYIELQTLSMPDSEEKRCGLNIETLNEYYTQQIEATKSALHEENIQTIQRLRHGSSIMREKE